MNDAGANPRPFQFRLIHLLVGTAAVGLFLGLTVPAFRAAREASSEHECRNKLRQIHLGLLNYHDTWRRFPPPYVADEAGTPMHSWRVLISPYLESNPFYNQYDFSEPWDGPNNSRLPGLWRSFACPSASSPGMTSYVAVVGPGSVWAAGQRPAGDADAAEGRSNAILIVEISDSNIHWMEPRDLSLDELETWSDPQHRPRLGGNHVRGGSVLFADGTIELLSRDAILELLRAMAAMASP